MLKFLRGMMFVSLGIFIRLVRKPCELYKKEVYLRW